MFLEVKHFFGLAHHISNLPSKDGGMAAICYTLETSKELEIIIHFGLLKEKLRDKQSTLFRCELPVTKIFRL